jgi:hypothetical protein
MRSLIRTIGAALLAALCSAPAYADPAALARDLRAIEANIVRWASPAMYDDWTLVRAAAALEVNCAQEPKP